MAITDNLIGLWTPSAGPTGYTLIDRSGRNNHGTLTNMAATDWAGSTVRGVAGWSLNFDGTDNVVSIGGSQVYAKLATPFTASIWFFTRTFGGQYVKLLMLRSDSTSAYEIGISNQTQYLGVLIGDNANYARLKTDTASTVFTGAWSHVVVTYNGGTRSTAGNFAVSLNGVPQTLTTAGAFSATTNATSIGLNANNNRHDGLVGEIAIADRAWAPAEAAEAYLAGNGAILRRLTGRSRRRVFGFVPPTFRAAWVQRSRLIGGGV